MAKRCLKICVLDDINENDIFSSSSSDDEEEHVIISCLMKAKKNRISISNYMMVTISVFIKKTPVVLKLTLENRLLTRTMMNISKDIFV